MISCWAAFIDMLSCMWPGGCRLNTPGSVPWSEEDRLWSMWVWDAIEDKWVGGWGVVLETCWKGPLWGDRRCEVLWIRRSQIYEQLGLEDSRQRKQLVLQPEVEKWLRFVHGSKGDCCCWCAVCSWERERGGVEEEVGWGLLLKAIASNFDVWH